MRSRQVRPFSVLFVLLLVLPLLPQFSHASSGLGVDALDDLPVGPGEAIADAPPAAVDAIDGLRPAVSDVRIAILGSGVDPEVLPQALRAQVGHPWGPGDALGYGTYAASIVLQVAPDAGVASFNLYGPQGLDSHRLHAALGWVSDHAQWLDAVLVTMPPHDYLDPVSRAMDDGDWRPILDEMAEHDIGRATGRLPAELRRPGLSEASVAEPRKLGAFRAGVQRWLDIRDAIGELREAGLAVVSPAGDLGPALQTIFGISNLPEVITVGGFDGRGISARSSSGPSMDGRVKPDLVAPTGLVGVLPAGSVLASDLAERGRLDDSLPVRWNAGEPSGARARLDSSLTAAAVVAAGVGGLRREGIASVDEQRGALVAASVPLPGEPVWRQGAGVLRGIPDGAFASSRPLALGHGDLGPQPAGDSWSVLVPFSGGAPEHVSTTLGAFAGVTPDPWIQMRTLGDGEGPAVSVGVSERGVRLAAPVGDGRYEGGVYCGYTEVMLPVAGGTVRPAVTIDGVPESTEEVPTCLVQGTRLRAFGFYIHDLPAEDLTFGLLPGLPEEASLLRKPLMILPVDPLHTKIFTAVTGPDGFAYFPNVPPGYYTVRQWSDYGSPVVATVTDVETGKPVSIEQDIGENPSYQDFDALVLSAAGWTEQDLRDRFGDGNVEPDPPTQGYWVKIGDRRIRVVLGELKKMPGPAVSSRYIDLLARDDFDWNVLPVDEALDLVEGEGAGGRLSDAWIVGPGPGDGFEAVFNPLRSASGGSEVLGVGVYPFNLTTPNYTAHMSLNFAYDVTNTVVVALVQIGNETAFGVVTPQGTVRSPAVGAFTPLLRNGVAISGHANGTANFEFAFLPRGAASGTLYLILLPSEPVQHAVAPLATATVSDMSFQLDTWQRTLWPAAFNEPHGMGHAFTFRSNYSERQMSAPGCRTVTAGGVTAPVCEEWQVLVHSAGDDAATVDLHDGSGASFGAGLGSSRAVYADPRRGVKDSTDRLAFGLPIGDGVAFAIDRPFRTNGRFWEQLVLYRDALSAHRGPTKVEILDNVPGRSNTLTRHVLGAVPVAAYVPFVTENVVVDPVALGLVVEETAAEPPVLEAALDVAAPKGPASSRDGAGGQVPAILPPWLRPPRF